MIANYLHRLSSDKNRQLQVVSYILLAFATTYWLLTSFQPLIDVHPFRQTQTALTALFLNHSIVDFLNYKTPVIGYPWSIPFELPLFQQVVSAIAALTHLDLSLVGRLTSVFFGLLLLYPVSKIITTLRLPSTVYSFFLILYSTSSIYLYWNRTFLIESMALCLTLFTLHIYLTHLVSRRHLNLRTIILLTILATLALCVKATTSLVPFAFIFLLCWLPVINNLTIKSTSRSLALSLPLIAAFLFLGAWTNHADSLKAQNDLGYHLTSAALRHWNYGHFLDRFSSELYIDVISIRMFAGFATIPALFLFFNSYQNSNSGVRKILLSSLFLSFAPLFLFSNLHIVHDYYQASCQIYLIFALSVACYGNFYFTSSRHLKMNLATLSLILIIGANLFNFIPYLSESLVKTNSKYELAKYVSANTDESSAIVVFGDDWSSFFAFHSKRYSFTLPDWPQWDHLNLTKSTVLRDSGRFLGGKALGAIISNSSLNSDQLHGSCPASHTKSIGEWTAIICRSS